MKLRRDQKGQVRVIEAFFAATLLLSCLAIIPSQNNTRNVASDNNRLENIAQNVFLSLNANGYLAKLSDAQEWHALGDCIESALPLTIWFNLTVYNSNGQPLNQYPICNGGAISDKVVSEEFVCASPNRNFRVYIFQLQLAVLD